MIVGGPKAALNAELHHLFPHRSFESIKCHRKNALYISNVQEYVCAIRNPIPFLSVETVTQGQVTTTPETVISQPVPGYVISYTDHDSWDPIVRAELRLGSAQDESGDQKGYSQSGL